MRQLADKKISLKQKQKVVQTGGFLSALLECTCSSDRRTDLGTIKMRKLIALEPEVYQSLQNKHQPLQTKIVNDLDREMQDILNTNQPESEKVKLYNQALQKSRLFMTSKPVEKESLSDATILKIVQEKTCQGRKGFEDSKRKKTTFLGSQRYYLARQTQDSWVQYSRACSKIFEKTENQH